MCVQTRGAEEVPGKVPQAIVSLPGVTVSISTC